MQNYFRCGGEFITCAHSSYHTKNVDCRFFTGIYGYEYGHRWAAYCSTRRQILYMQVCLRFLWGYGLATRYVERIANHHIRMASLCICSLSGIGAIVLYWMN